MTTNSQAEQATATIESARPQVSTVPRPTQPVVMQIGQSNVTFNVADDADSQAYFCLGIRKSGSTMLTKLVNFLARRNNINVVDVPGTVFKEGGTVADWEAADMSGVLRPGNLYTGFRTFPAAMAQTAIFKTSSKVFMFRDPRDAIVSEYYSNAYSHHLPKPGTPGYDTFVKKRETTQATGLDEFVIARGGALARTMMASKSLLEDPTCLNVRYEDFVFQKPRLVAKILAHFKWECHPAQIQNMLAKLDVVPSVEDPKAFIRKAVPGDHRVKLDTTTIRRLNKIMQEALTTYDYV